MTAQKNRMKRILAGVAIVAMAFAVIPSKANAQEIVLTAIPPKVELKGDPGDTLTAQFKLRNDSSEYILFGIKVEDFIVADKIGTPVPIATNTNNRWSLASWVSAPSEIPVDAAGIQLINVTIKIPKTALPGGHYAMITYNPNPDAKAGDLKQTGNVITPRVGSLIYVVVNGTVDEKANITSFSAPQFSEQGPVTFTGTVESLSGTHINPKGTITISDPINNKVANVQMETGNIFPESSRDFSTKWDQKWGWGRYKADLNLVYGTTGSVIAASTYFWLFPIRLVIYTLVGIISVLIVIILLSKRGKKHQEELEKEVQELKEELKTIENK